MNICVVGLGKIGLPLAVQFAMRGHKVLGADIDSLVVQKINAGQEPFPGEENLAEYLNTVRSIGSFEATTDTESAVSQSGVVVVVVPLLVNNESQPDFRAMDAATLDVARGLRPGTLVSYETTLPVGTTRDRFAPTLERESGLTVEEDFFVCFSPERVYSGRIFADLRAYPKLVGGIGEASAARAVDFYKSVLLFDERKDLNQPNGVWDLGSSEAAELAKLAETTYRDINIGFANELAKFADRVGIDIEAVIDATNSQPFSHIHRPGIAVGGHCIPVYPRFYLDKDPDALLPAAAREVNLDMPRYAVGLLEEEIGSLKGLKVAILGAAYRGGVKETAFSGVFPLAKELEGLGASVVVEDPLYTDEELRDLGFSPYHFGEPCDAAVIQSNHAEYRGLSKLDIPGASVVLDGRGCVDSEVLARDGVQVIRLGMPDLKAEPR